jgi:hypothetical protein
MMNLPIELTRNEMYLAAVAGVRRRIEGYGPRTNEYFDGSTWDTDVHGAASELAVAKYLGVYWGSGEAGAPDIVSRGRKVEVRCITDPKKKLLVREAEQRKRDSFFALVLAPPKGFTYTILGGLPGDLIFGRADWRADPGSQSKPVWLVPQHELGNFTPKEEGD